MRSGSLSAAFTAHAISRDDDDDDDDDEDDSAELLRELEKIKRERAAEKERQEREQSASTAAAREAEIATANPLLEYLKSLFSYVKLRRDMSTKLNPRVMARQALSKAYVVVPS